jgi:ferredoxin-type protein NapH
VGLFFATLFALLRLLQFHEPAPDLVVFPAVILLELVFLKKWCGRWCPMGALFSLFSRFNRRFVPAVDAGLCLKSHQTDCRACREACAFGVDPVRVVDPRKRGACTKCRECADNCPARAIRFPWKKRALT